MKNTARKLALLCALGLASLAGAPVNPDWIQDLLRQLSQPKVTHTIRKRDKRGAP